MADHETKRTTDEDTIKKWCEERGGQPATVAATGSKNDPGLLRIDFDDSDKDPGLTIIHWSAFFEAMKENELEFVYQEHTKDGDISRFCKFVSKE
ncbi:hypothetical protein [Stratiformator vulcanicus]|uniref:Uncharacterized protein n=1 Tax=Stratiformator vulcanicus TaxID=2527980 RepID=A0A517R661_9PLAN|nr:hypothetical protein [Stratiformator vulcanicus]QDT39342.1 hypothetical protein Pan189_37480 [Stratiformator vulcanicus]